MSIYLYISVVILAIYMTIRHFHLIAYDIFNDFIVMIIFTWVVDLTQPNL